MSGKKSIDTEFRRQTKLISVIRVKPQKFRERWNGIQNFLKAIFLRIF